MLSSKGSARKHLIALVGFGTVAKGLCQILLEKRDILKRDYQFEFEIVAVSTRSRGTMFHPAGLSLSYLNYLALNNEPFVENTKEWDAEDMIRNSNATVVIELAHTDFVSGEPALTHCRTAFETGKHIISGNKGPAAVAYSEMKALARKRGCAFLNEATVLSGTPVFSFFNHSLRGNQVNGLRGILNGATNFILSEMETGSSFDQALLQAQKLGYLEADSSADIDGYDALAKLAILANDLFDLAVDLSDIKREGIATITQVHIEAARREGKRWKLVATLSIDGAEIIAQVKPEKLSLSDPLAQVNGTLNAITFSTDLLGDVTITGPGAGGRETGYAVLSDLLTLNTGDFS
ncbi:MAG: homoserine dehydrogenase [Candidatus Marinimicrobia bacterium]|nr:homoserine dehydrogenase [Candidatus Neomarinimicrobiota bacterium]